MGLDQENQTYEAPVPAMTPMSKEQMLAQWKKTTNSTTTAQKTPNTDRKPLAQRDANSLQEGGSVLSSQQKGNVKMAWEENNQAVTGGVVQATPTRSSHQGPSISDLKARVDVIRRESILRDVRRESVMGTPSMACMTPNRNLMPGNSTQLAMGEAGVEMPSCLDAAMACFDEETFVKECKAALGCKIRASRSAPEQQRDEAVTIIKSLRRCLKHMFSKKEALSKAAVQYEDEVSQMIASMKLQTEADNNARTETFLQTKELFKEIKDGDEGQALHFKARMEKLEALEAQLQKSERSLEKERVSVREEERKRALEEAQAQLNSSMSEIEKRESQLKKAEAELKERRLEWQAMEQEFKIVAEEAEKEKQEKKQIEEQNHFLQKKCTSLETELRP